MSEYRHSQTALGAAAARAAHQILDAPPLILDDPVILRLLEPEALERIRRYRHPRRGGYACAW